MQEYRGLAHNLLFSGKIGGSLAPEHQRAPHDARD